MRYKNTHKLFALSYYILIASFIFCLIGFFFDVGVTYYEYKHLGLSAFIKLEANDYLTADLNNNLTAFGQSYNEDIRFFYSPVIIIKLLGIFMLFGFMSHINHLTNVLRKDMIERTKKFTTIYNFIFVIVFVCFGVLHINGGLSWLI
jgi:hypothetical protein